MSNTLLTSVVHCLICFYLIYILQNPSLVLMFVFGFCEYCISCVTAPSTDCSWTYCLILVLSTAHWAPLWEVCYCEDGALLSLSSNAMKPEFNMICQCPAFDCAPEHTAQLRLQNDLLSSCFNMKWKSEVKKVSREKLVVYAGKF